MSLFREQNPLPIHDYLGLRLYLYRAATSRADSVGHAIPTWNSLRPPGYLGLPILNSRLSPLRWQCRQSVQIEAKTSGFWVPYSTPSGAHSEEHHAVCVSYMRPINTYVPDPPSKLPLNNGKPIDKCRERTPISTTTGSSTNNASANVTRSIRDH